MESFTVTDNCDRFRATGREGMQRVISPKDTGSPLPCPPPLLPSSVGATF